MSASTFETFLQIRKAELIGFPAVQYSIRASHVQHLTQKPCFGGLVLLRYYQYRSSLVVEFVLFVLFQFSFHRENTKLTSIL